MLEYSREGSVLPHHFFSSIAPEKRSTQMVKLLTPGKLGLISLILASLACSTFAGGGADEPAGSSPPVEQPGSGASGPVTRQWAVSATASTEYDNPSWSAFQATGAPNVPECADDGRAWASSSSNTAEWIELTYAVPVAPTEINIHQTYNPTQIVKVEVISSDGSTHEVWTGAPQAQSQCPYVMNIGVNLGQGIRVQTVRILIDQSVLGLGWNEIDAVELVGAP
jgi:hypothetical protein